MKKSMVIAAVMMGMVAGAVEGKLRTAIPAVRVDVWVTLGPDVAIDGATLTAAQTRATQLLNDADVLLQWHYGKTPESEVGPQVIRLQFVKQPPKELLEEISPNALAAAKPYDKGHTIRVFQDRLTGYVWGFAEHTKPLVIGHVLAHEIVHVLEGVARHSISGLMAANWGWREVRAITGPGLKMAEEDRRLIRVRVGCED